METNRRSLLKRITAGLAGLAGIATVQNVSATPLAESDIKTGEVVLDQEVPLFSGHKIYNGLVYVAGKGAHFEGDITAHTKHVLDEVQKELEKAGTTMDKVLKVNVYLADLNDYKAMNEAYRGRFGNNPPVRTTIAAYGGVPGDSLVEIDCIAALK
jgi:2-iminobutanoate/2-iminopropanoate deaminase